MILEEARHYHGRNVWSAFSSMLPTIATIIVVGEYLGLLSDIGFIIVCGAFLLPHLYVSAEYLLHDRNGILYTSEGKLYLVQGETHLCLDAQNVPMAILFQSRTRKDWVQFFSWQSLFFVGLVTSSGQRLAMTMTLAKSLEDVLKSTDIQLEIEYVEFPSLMHWLK